jgi:hypothetical protein
MSGTECDIRFAIKMTAVTIEIRFTNGKHLYKLRGENYLPRMRFHDIREHAGQFVPAFLQVLKLRNNVEAKNWRLLRVLFICRYQMSS